MRIATTVTISLKLLVLVLHFSCGERGSHHIDAISGEKSKGVYAKPPASSLDTLTLNYPAVVFYRPDSNQLSLIKSKTEPAAYESLVHENYYLFRNAHAVIKKNHPQLRIEEAINKRFLFFNAGGIAYCIDLDTKKEPYGMIAFDTIHQPKQVDLANVDTELHFYFGNPK